MTSVGTVPSTGPLPWVGRRVPRREDGRLLRGEGTFVADLVEPGDGHVAFARSPVAYGRIRHVDVTAASAMPGVIAVFTADDFATIGRIGALGTPDGAFVDAYRFSMTHPSLECLASELTHYVGQPIALVVASSRALAEDAAEMIDVDIDPLPVDDDDRAKTAEMSFELGEPPPDSDALTTVDLELYMARHSATPIETRGIRVVATGSHLRLTTSTQVPHLVKRAIVAATDVGEDELHVDVVDVGGGFGTKANVYPEEVLLAVVGARLGRPVVWIEDRTEHFVAAAQGRDQRQRVRLSVDADGFIRSLQVDLSIDLGAGSLWTSGMLANSCIHLLGPYRLPHVKVHGYAHLSHRTPSAQYRGAGRPEACFALERALDAAACKLGIDRLEIRRKNLFQRSEFPVLLEVPYRDGVPISFDGGDWQRCLDDVVAVLPPASSHDRASEYEVVGWGTACMLEATGRGPYEAARIWVQRDGRIQLKTGGASAGQGHETVFTQVVADALGVDPSQVDVHRASTDGLSDGIGTFGSRTAVLAGNATHVVAGELRRRLHHATDAPPGADVRVAIEGVSVDGDPHSWDELLDMHGDDAFDVTHLFAPTTVTWTMGAHAVLVAVDPGTGRARILDYAVVHEGGRDINPDIVFGQLCGGVVQGLGGALLEQHRFDEQLQPTAINFADYLLPSAQDAPNVVVRSHHVPTANPLGVRGVGESGTIGVYAAVASAIDDAVGRLVDRAPASGVFVTSTPMNAEHLRHLIADASELAP